jgi:hypothetical protein
MGADAYLYEHKKTVLGITIFLILCLLGLLYYLYGLQDTEKHVSNFTYGYGQYGYGVYGM